MITRRIAPMRSAPKNMCSVRLNPMPSAPKRCAVLVSATVSALARTFMPMRTVVLQRHGYGRGRHRFHPGFLDFARHCGFQPRLCAPYRAQTKGKVERFIRYLRESFYVPLSSRLAQEGLIVDRETANLTVKRWLREVANVRVHGTTSVIPAERLASERLQLQ